MTETPRRGDILCSRKSSLRLLVIAPGDADRMPVADGTTLVRGRPARCSVVGLSSAGSDLRAGQRYVDGTSGLTLLCVGTGRGPVRYDGRPLVAERAMSRQVAAALIRLAIHCANQRMSRRELFDESSTHDSPG
jgi:hypothetical protein